MSIDKYGLNIKKYVDTLPNTDVIIVYFMYSRKNRDEIEPYIAENIRVMKINNKELLINTSSSGKWTMIYKLDSLKCLVSRMDTEVVSVTSQFTSAFEQIGSGIECTEGQIGNHLTLGFFDFNNINMLDTHTTEYIENPTKPGNFLIEHPIKCIIHLEKPLDQETKCLTKQGKESTHIFYKKYNDEPDTIAIIKYVKNIATKMEIQSGNRGGSFTIKNGKKRYLKRRTSIQGGAIPEGIKDIIYMVYDKLIRHVLDSISLSNSLPVDVSMIYDTKNYFGLKIPVLVIIYDIQVANQRLVFYMNLEHATRAHEYYERLELDLIKKTKADDYRKRCSEEFEEQRIIQANMLRAIAT